MRAEFGLALTLVLLLGASPRGGAQAPPARGPAPAPADPAPLQVAVSVPPQVWLVERVGGRHVQVTTMLSTGGSEHAVELRPRQLAALEQASVYVLVGHPAFLLESQRIRPLLRDRPGVLLVDMAQGVVSTDEPAEPTPHGSHGHEHGGSDPHLWLTPSVVRGAAVNVARGLQQADPAHADEYARNLQMLQQELDALDATIRSILGKPDPALPPRRFLVYHPAWGYFAREYGLEQVAIEDEGKEPSPRQLIQMIERVRALGMRTVFVQRGISTRSARVIAREIGARVVELDPMALDWKASMLQAARELAASFAQTTPSAESAGAR